jgi:hypothetical protein
MILTSYLYVSVRYKKNNGVSSKLATVSIVTLWIQVVMANCCWEQWTVVEHDPRSLIKHHNKVVILMHLLVFYKDMFQFKFSSCLCFP